jgi:hypothetical protein
MLFLNLLILVSALIVFLQNKKKKDLKMHSSKNILIKKRCISFAQTLIPASLKSNREEKKKGSCLKHMEVGTAHRGFTL